MGESALLLPGWTSYKCAFSFSLPSTGEKNIRLNGGRLQEFGGACGCE